MTNTPYHKAPSLDPIVDQLGLEVIMHACKITIKSVNSESELTNF